MGDFLNPKKCCVLCQKRRAITTVHGLHTCFPCALKLSLTEVNEAEKEFEKEALPCPKCGAPTKILGVDINGDGKVVFHFACAGCYLKEREKTRRSLKEQIRKYKEFDIRYRQGSEKYD